MFWVSFMLSEVGDLEPGAAKAYKEWDTGLAYSELRLGRPSSGST